MSASIIRPATADDIRAVNDGYIPFRVRALAAERDGKLLGVGGLGFRPDGMVVAFLILAADVTGRSVMVTLHRAGLRLMDMARELGFHHVIADADLNASPAAERWLARLGFEPRAGSWVWENKA